MGLLDLLLGRDPSAQWPPHKRLAVEFDLAAGAINGVSFGSPATAIRKFGRPENAKPFKTGMFCYFASGFYLSTEKDRIVYFAGFLEDTDKAGYRTCDLTLRVPGRGGFSVAQDVTQKQIFKTFGNPEHTDNDPEEIVFFFDCGRLSLEFECSPQLRLRRVNIYPKGTQKHGKA